MPDSAAFRTMGSPMPQWLDLPSARYCSSKATNGIYGAATSPAEREPMTRTPRSQRKPWWGLYPTLRSSSRIGRKAVSLASRNEVQSPMLWSSKPFRGPSRSGRKLVVVNHYRRRAKN